MTWFTPILRKFRSDSFFAYCDRNIDPFIPYVNMYLSITSRKVYIVVWLESRRMDREMLVGTEV